MIGFISCIKYKNGALNEIGNKNYDVCIINMYCFYRDYSIVDYFENQSEYHESKYELEEIESSIYARTCHTVSTVPVHNYYVIEICINTTMKAEPTIWVKCIYNVRNAECI